MSELKPCPFCGGKPKMHDQQVAEDCVETWIACTNCGVSTERIEGAYSERPTALLAWNRRAEGIGESRREPLTEDAICEMRRAARNDPRCIDQHWFVLMARAVEQHHGITPQAGKESGDA